ncbi:hypothetical protein PVK06_039559 [Gossypium arboreum]|uniref:Uncharacterized protein n=1 Tax=Gossypium arboreum TaxID=29729 RepID=A0ABR0N374_GOSAR|nr:hypothetical protein PVK06_039559 [Gossypium arboreum]
MDSRLFKAYPTRSPDAFYLPLYILDDNTTPASEIGVVQKLWGVCVCVHLRLSKKQRTLPMVFFNVRLFSVEQENEFVFRIKHDFVGSDFRVNVFCFSP